MKQLILKMSMTLDGLVGGPNGEADWMTRSPEGVAWIASSVAKAGVHIMGATSYRAMATFYPTSTLPFAAPMNAIPKVVFSKKGVDAELVAAIEAKSQGANAEVVRSWTHPRVASGDLVEEITRLKAEAGGDIYAHAGASFARSLIAHDLVDEYQLMVHPVILGRGMPIFSEREGRLGLELVEVTTFPQGVASHVYRRTRS